MKILLAAPQDKTVLGIITHYCQKAMEAIGNEVVVFDFRKRPYSRNHFVPLLKSLIRPFFPSLPSPYDLPKIREAADQETNHLLLELVNTYKPDILLVLCGENILPETLTRIRKGLNITTVNWFHDTLLSPLRKELIQNALPFYNYLFVVDSLDVLKHLELKVENIYTLALGCEPQVHKRIKLSEKEKNMYGSDIAFVGTVTLERERILEKLAEFNMKIWGRWQRESPRLKGCYQKKDVYTEEAVKIYNASKIVLDIHSLFGIEKEIFNVTPRLFEVPASGAFLLTNSSLQVGSFYELNHEIAVYHDVEELKRLIRYYLAHEKERQDMAQRAFVRAHREHTYLQRLKTLLEYVKK